MAAANFFVRGAGIIRQHPILAACCAGAVGLFGATLLFVWLALPYILKSEAQAYIRGRGGDRLTIDQLSIMPLFEPELRIDNLRLTEPDGTLLLGFKQLSIDLSLSSIIHRALVIDAITLDGPRVAITLLPRDQLNWDALIASPQGSGGGSRSATPPGILIRKFALSDGQIDLADRRTSAPQSVEIKPLMITLTDLSTLAADQKGAYALTAKSSLGAEVDWSGTVSLTPLSIAGNFRLGGLSLTRLATLLPVPPKLAPPQGTASLATRYNAGMIGGKLDFQLADLSIGIDGLRIAGKQNPDASFALGHFGLNGGQFDWIKRSVAIESVTLTGGGVAARRLADGGIDLLDLMPPSSGASPDPPRPSKPAPATPPPKAITDTASKPENPWHYRLGRFAVTGFAAEFRDQTVEPEADFALQNLTAEVTGMSENLDTPLPTHLALTSRDGGNIVVDGTVVPGAPSADLRIGVDGLALTPIQPYIASATILKLVGGTVSANGQATYGHGMGKYIGGLSVLNLRIMQGQGGRPFLGWKSLSTDSLTAGPSAINIRELRLDGLNTALTVAKDRTVNVTQILRAPKHATDTHAARAPPAAPSPHAAVAAPVIDIGQFRISNSQLDYADLSLLLPFATHIHDLEGTIADISTQPGAAPARLKLAGRIDEDGRASASGRFDLLEPTQLLDIDVAFDDVALTNLTPYLATFAGRRIDSGKLTLDLQYKINHGQLAGDNRIILDQLSLGGRVRSPEARDLPLDFAIAILKDSHGRIDLGIPISGSLADPRFSYGQLIWKAVSTLLTRIVTSPFQAIGALFGSGGNAASLTFVAGQSTLTPVAQRHFVEFAASLNSRPTLAVTIRGTWSEADRVALRDHRLRQAIADRLGLPTGADLSKLGPDQPNVGSVLEDLYSDRYGQGGLSALKDGYRQANSGKLKESIGDRAVSMVTGLLGTKPSLSAAEITKMKGVDFNALLYQRLRDAEDVPDATLESLGQARGQAAVSILLGARVAPDRVRLRPVERVAGNSDNIPLDMTLSPLTETNTVKTPQL